jgi:hypothetical protein
MNILVKASTFGADLFWLTHYLDKQPGVSIKVLLSDPDKFLKEGIAQKFPISAELRKKSLRSYLFRPKAFKPDVTIMDNKIPIKAPSPKGFMLWHGFGWKGPNDVEEFSWLHRNIRLAWGSAMEPNPDFVWQCFGDWDFEHRTKISGFHPDNCRVLGAASHDLLRDPLPKEEVQPYYPFDIVNRKTILIAPTWHYGEVFAHWGKDKDLFEKLFQRIEDHNANVILRLHDSFRFSPEYVEFLEDLSHRHPNVLLKFKDRDPDNLMDMMASDILITNFSSIANLYYATNRPTLHIYPVKDSDEEFQWRKSTVLGMRSTKIDSVKYIWKLDPEENGGLLARNFEMLLSQLDQVIGDPDCCKEKSQAFLDKYMLGADGKSCERIWSAIQDLVGNEK